MKTFRTNGAPVQITNVILSNQAVLRLYQWSRLMHHLSVRWFGCSHCLPFMFNFGCHVPEMVGRCEAHSTAFNSFINQASVLGMNYWMNLEETAYFYFLLDGHVVLQRCALLLVAAELWNLSFWHTNRNKKLMSILSPESQTGNSLSPHSQRPSQSFWCGSIYSARLCTLITLQTHMTPRAHQSLLCPSAPVQTLNSVKGG